MRGQVSTALRCFAVAQIVLDIGEKALIVQAADRWQLYILVDGTEFSFKAMLAIQLHEST